MHGGPPIAAIVLRYVYPFSVNFTGARILPNTGFGSKGNGIKHIEPSRTILVLNVFDVIDSETLCHSERSRIVRFAGRKSQYVSTGERLPSSGLRSFARSSPRTATRKSQISLSSLRNDSSENSSGGVRFLLKRATPSNARS